MTPQLFSKPKINVKLPSTGNHFYLDPQKFLRKKSQAQELWTTFQSGFTHMYSVFFYYY